MLKSYTITIWQKETGHFTGQYVNFGEKSWLASQSQDRGRGSTRSRVTFTVSEPRLPTANLATQGSMLDTIGAIRNWPERPALYNGIDRQALVISHIPSLKSRNPNFCVCHCLQCLRHTLTR